MKRWDMVLLAYPFDDWSGAKLVRKTLGTVGEQIQREVLERFRRLLIEA